MSMTFRTALRGLLSASIASAALLCAGAAWPADGAKPAAAASDLIPDFSSNNKLWVLTRGFVKVPGDTGPGPIVPMSDAAVAAKFNKPGYKTVRFYTNPLGDTSNPILQPWAKAKMDARNLRVVNGGSPFNSASRCWPGGVPGILLFPGEPIAFLQTPKEVWILWKRDAQIRRVYMNVPHSKNPGSTWYGESVGHYENGDTLVVDTIGLDDKGPLDRLETPHSKQLHVVERFKLTNGGKNIEETVTVTDPGAFTVPWKARVDFETAHTPRTDHWEEDICNEAGDGDFLPADAAPSPHADKKDF